MTPRSVLQGTLLGTALLLFASCSSAPPPKEEIFEKRNRAAQYLEFGNRYFKEVQYDPAMRFYELALEYYTSVDDREGQVTAYNSIGKILFLLEDPENALDNYRKAYGIATALGKASLILQCANNIGEVHIRRGENQEALRLYQEILASREVSGENSRELAVLHHNRAVVLRNTGALDEASREAETARDLNFTGKRYEELASNYYLLSSIHSKRENYPEALKFAELALEYDKKMENSLGIGQDLTAVGIIREKMGRIDLAHDMYKRAFLVYRALRYTPGMIRSLEALEKTAGKLNLKDEAEQYREAGKKLQSSDS